ncbi:hypothetical protein K2Q00_02155 [Patescibacteria group bacterium]|nr:hypothetical protein [Patescibacteria group bacterium]
MSTFKNIEDIVKADFKKGLKLLDRVMPGWRAKVKKPVSISDAASCPIAQITGSNFFHADLGKFGFDPDTVAQFKDVSLKGSDRVARQEWASQFGFSTGERHQKNERGHWCLSTLGYATEMFNKLWNTELGFTA